MKPMGEGRIYKKGITYTDKGKKVKDTGLKPDTCPTTAGMESVIKTPAPTRPYSNG